MPAQIVIELDPETSQDTINALKQQIAEQNIKGLSARTTEKLSSTTALSASEVQNIITIVLGSTAVTAGVKGLFDILKHHMTLKDAKDNRTNELKIEKIRSKEMLLNSKTKTAKQLKSN